MAALPAVTTLMLAANSVTATADMELPLSLCAPDSGHTFTPNVTNQFFPLPASQQWIYLGKEGGQNIGLRITVLGGTETFYPGPDAVATRRVEETEWEDDDADGVIDAGEFVIETSINYYAQTGEGTVCYFGEDVMIFLPDGGFTTEGAWRADDPGNAPGIFMLAEPETGMSFQQEVAPGVAEDMATIVADGKAVRTPAGRFTDTIRVRDFNPLDGSKGTKSYATDVGLIQDGPLLLTSY